MSLFGLVLKNISGSAFRSWVVLLCALIVSGFALSTTLIIRGAEASLLRSQQRLGADIVVVPEGTEAKVEGALLTGKPVSTWMPAENVAKIGKVPGVAVASPQLFLASLANASCCAAEELFMVAFDPGSDFTIQPWLQKNLGRNLTLGEAIGGDLVFVPEGDDYIKLYGYFVTLTGSLEATGTGLDQTLFFTFDTAHDMARISRTRGERPLDIPASSVSAVMVKVAPGENPEAVAVGIMRSVSGVTPVTSPNLFLSVRSQLQSLLRGLLVLLGITWAMSISFIGLVFSVAVDERRREIGVLRALGCTRLGVLRSILAEAGVLAVGGGAVGIALSGLATHLFHNLIVRTLGIPFLLPSILDFATLVVGGLALALASVTVAALVPALRVSYQDPALAMRE